MMRCINDPNRSGTLNVLTQYRFLGQIQHFKNEAHPFPSLDLLLYSLHEEVPR